MGKIRLLVVVDMQNDFLTGPLGNGECASTIKPVCEAIRTGKYDGVILTRDTHQEGYLSTQEGMKLPVEHCFEGTKGWEICDEVMTAVNEKFDAPQIKIFDKPTFGSAKLGAYLQEQYGDGADLELDFVGVCTGICVINNVSVSRAFCPECVINVIEKGCACVTVQTHQTALEAMKTFQINII